MIEAFHLDGAVSLNFAVAWTPPPGTPTSFGVLCVPPFGEENNKSRRMIALQSSAWCVRGGVVLLVDLTGTGDSLSDARQATWENWIEDLHIAWRYLSARVNGPKWLWGIRSGALLCTQSEPDLDPGADGLLLWQPVVSGKSFVNQFLRLAVARRINGPVDPREPEPRDRLVRGEFVEVAGYDLNPALLLPLENLHLGDAQPRCKVVWMECGTGETIVTGPAAKRVMEKWETASVDLRHENVQSAPFWASQEIETSEALVARSIRSVPGSGHGPPRE